MNAKDPTVRELLQVMLNQINLQIEMLNMSGTHTTVILNSASDRVAVYRMS